MRLKYGQINSPTEEFWYHVSQQYELLMAVNQTALHEISAVNLLGGSVRTKTEEQLTGQRASDIIKDPRLVELMRILISVSDKRRCLDLSYQFSRLPHPRVDGATLCG